jgi:hypothetical protein
MMSRFEVVGDSGFDQHPALKLNFINQYLKGEKEMKAKLSAFFITIFTVGVFAFAQDVVSDVGNAAKDTGRVTEKAARKTAHGAVKATKVTVHGSEKAATETGRGSEKAAKGTARGTAKVAEKTGHGVKEAVAKI